MTPSALPFEVLFVPALNVFHLVLTHSVSQIYHPQFTDRQINLQIERTNRWHSWDFNPGLLRSKIRAFSTTLSWIQSLSVMLSKLPKFQMFDSLDISNEHSGRDSSTGPKTSRCSKVPAE